MGGYDNKEHLQGKKQQKRNGQQKRTFHDKCYKQIIRKSKIK